MNSDNLQLAVHEQKDPLLIYKFEAKELFFSMIDDLNKDILTFLMKADLPTSSESNKKTDKHVDNKITKLPKRMF